MAFVAQPWQSLQFSGFEFRALEPVGGNWREVSFFPVLAVLAWIWLATGGSAPFWAWID